MPSSPPSAPQFGVPSARAEAARYALLRRLAPSMRHHLVVNLQPIGMIFEVMDRRLRAPTPDLAHVQDSAQKINGFAKAALSACIDVVGWLAPDDTVAVAVEDGVRECSALLATSLSFRGYALRPEVTAMPGRVRRAALRSTLTGALLHCTDFGIPPADLAVAAAPEQDGALVTVEVRARPGDKGFGGEANYRKLEWDDLLALAEADGVRVAGDAQRIELHLPWVAEPPVSAG